MCSHILLLVLGIATALTFPTWNARSMLADVTPARTAASPAR